MRDVIPTRIFFRNQPFTQETTDEWSTRLNVARVESSEGDGGNTPQCRRDGTMAAFTVTGHHVIHVCAHRFAQRFERQRVAGEILVIHEMLHTLGLGENPPSSRDITARVAKRCGGS